MKLFDRTVKGFDTVIGANTSLVGGVLNISGVAVIDGNISESVLNVEDATVTKNSTISVKQLMSTVKIIIEGRVEAESVTAALIVVKSGGFLMANTISYAQIAIETGGHVQGALSLSSSAPTT